MNEILGHDWHEEVGSPSDERAAVRAQYYEKRAELKGAINEDLSGLRLDRTPVTRESKWLYGVLESAFGAKKTDKILDVTSKEGSGFNVDKFAKGDTVSIEEDGEILYLVKRNKEGDLLERAPLATSAKEETPVQPEKSEQMKYSPDLVQERWQLVLDEVSFSLGDQFTINSELLSAGNQLDRKIIISFGGLEKQLIVQHALGVDERELYNNDHLSTYYNNEAFPTVGRAAYAASLDLKPEDSHAGHDHFEVDSELPLDEQWLNWEAKMQESCDAAGVSLKINGGDRLKTIKLNRGGKRAVIRIVRNLFSKKKGDWSNEHCSIFYQGESSYANPLDAVNYALSQLLDDKPLEVTPPWKIKQHKHGGNGDGHVH